MSQPAAPLDVDLPEQIRIRQGKRAQFLAEGIEPYPASVPVTDSLEAVRESWGHLEAEQESGVEVGVAGRVVFVRNTGKLCFATLQSGAGSRLQVMLSLAVVGEELLAR